MHWLFAITILIGSCLLFLVQLICAKMLLPSLGGAPAVWNTCMVFFQAGLLLGYTCAHFGPRLLGIRLHAVVHLLLLAVPFALLPAVINKPSTAPAHPTLWLVQMLTTSVGLPFFALAASAPLLQLWCGQATRRDPYSLYAASNAGSFAALVLYPFVIEPNFTLQQQAALWTFGYGALVAGSLACAVCLLQNTSNTAVAAGFSLRSPTPAITPIRVSWIARLRWLLLAFVPSSLLISVTSFLTTDIAAIPLLWCIPLGIYLLTFVLTFARRPWLAHGFMIRWMPMIVVALASLWFLEGTDPVLLVLCLHLLVLFWIAMVCHGELARTRPGADDLTMFYWWLALGGVLGGMFSALAAPLIFTGLAEYPLMIVLACLLRPAAEAAHSTLLDSQLKGSGEPTFEANALVKWVTSNASRADFIIPGLLGTATLLLVLAGRFFHMEPGPASVAFMFIPPLVFVYLSQNHPLRFGLGLGFVFLAGLPYHGIHGSPLYRERTFFGVHRVTEQGGFRKLFHGNILHGEESLDPTRRGEPLTYYTHSGPIGQIMAALGGDRRLERVGLIGLGTGALASYAAHGQHWTFLEIDPAVARIASPEMGLFSYLKNCRGKTDIVLGDGRLSLSRSAEKFGLLVIDAFGSDAIPLHLLTCEALRMYLEHLTDHGVLAFHISNNYVDLEPVLANLAQHAGLTSLIQRDLSPTEADLKRGKSASVWLVIGRTEQDLDHVAANGRWAPARVQHRIGVWTDDFTNLAAVLQ